MTSPSTDRRFGVNAGLAFKAPVRLATTANITLSGLQTIDGATTVADDRVLVKDQTTTTQNGIYVASSGAWTRDIDANGNRDLVKGTMVVVTEGSQAWTVWRLSGTNPITPDTSGITFALSLTAAISTLSFTQAGTGAVARSAQEKMRESFSLFDFMTAAQVADVLAKTYLLDVTSAVIAAIAAATVAGVAVSVPLGGYSLTPTARIDLTTDFIGISPANTLFRVATTYVGEVFRNTGSYRVAGFQVRYGAAGTTKTAGSIGIRGAPTTISSFTGHQVYSNVWVFGFEKAWDVGNLFLSSWTNCRGEFGAYGLYCNPDSSTGNGYVTTLSFNNCTFTDNTQNRLMTPTMQAHGAVFNGGSDERGTTTASQFTRIRQLEHVSFYCEGSSGISSMRLTDCTVGFNGIYLNGTGGLEVGTSTLADINRFTNGTATDILLGADGTQQVSIRNSAFPAASNTLSFLRLVIENTVINGITYNFRADSLMHTKGVFNRAKVTVNNNAAFTYAVPADTSKVLFTGTQASSIAFTLPAVATTLDGYKIEIFSQSSANNISWASAGGTFLSGGVTFPAGTLHRWELNGTVWTPA